MNYKSYHITHVHSLLAKKSQYTALWLATFSGSRSLVTIGLDVLSTDTPAIQMNDTKMNRVTPTITQHNNKQQAKSHHISSIVAHTINRNPQTALIKRNGKVQTHASDKTF